jgi:hypothetical protein
MAKTLAHGGSRRARHDGGGFWAVGLVALALALAVWGAWRLGVLAGDRADWRRGLPDFSHILRQAPAPQPPPLPTQRRPAVTTQASRG